MTGNTPIQDGNKQDQRSACDEQAGVMVYGHILIKDKDSGQTLVNKRA